VERPPSWSTTTEAPRPLRRKKPHERGRRTPRRRNRRLTRRTASDCLSEDKLPLTPKHKSLVVRYRHPARQLLARRVRVPHMSRYNPVIKSVISGFGAKSYCVSKPPDGSRFLTTIETAELRGVSRTPRNPLRITRRKPIPNPLRGRWGVSRSRADALTNLRITRRGAESRPR
jgi:hypothetical protein